MNFNKPFSKKILALIFASFLLSFFCYPSYSKDIPATENLSETAAVKQISFDAENLKISLSQKTEFKIFTISKPQRLVIDLKNTKFADNFEQKKLPDFVNNFRFRKNENNLRIVFEVSDEINTGSSDYDENLRTISCEIKGKKPPQKSEQPSKEQSKPENVVKKIEEKLDGEDASDEFIIEKNGNVVRKYKLRKTGADSTSSKESSSNPPKAVVKTKNQAKNSARNPVIVIDAGHGGKDPGTIGVFAHSKEKNITLAYAKELAKNLQQNPNYRVFLTRDSDEFLPLKERVSRARQKKADLFISLHANAIDDKNVSGFSIYTLSEKSSDKQAELLAQKENRADIINGVDFSSASKDVVKTLIDLAQRESKNSSSSFAQLAVDEIRNSEVEILDNTHRFAGFMVLTAPDMASVLIELGYLSNKKEEKLINSLRYRRMIAKKLSKAVDDYFSKNPVQ